MNPHTPRQEKIKKEGPKFQKIWEKSCSCNRKKMLDQENSEETQFSNISEVSQDDDEHNSAIDKKDIH